MDIIGAALKALGVKVTPEAAKQIEAVLPQLPAKINETIGFVLAWQKNFDQRLQNIEESQRSMMEFLLTGKVEVKKDARRGDGNGDPIGPGNGDSGGSNIN